MLDVSCALPLSMAATRQAMQSISKTCLSVRESVQQIRRQCTKLPATVSCMTPNHRHAPHLELDRKRYQALCGCMGCIASRQAVKQGLLRSVGYICRPRAVLPRFPAWLGPSSLGGACFQDDFQMLEQDAVLGEAMKGDVHR